MTYSIGIDIGGTNTDVVLIDQSKHLVASTKVTTTQPLEIGVASGISRVLSGIQVDKVRAVYVGTTHALNALIRAESLLSVGLIRIAGHRPQIQPGLRWNSALRSAIIRESVTISGGFECHGGEISPFRKEEMQEAIEKLLSLDVEGFAIVSCFGNLYPQHEEEALHCLQEITGKDVSVTLSHEMGGVGFLERENATLLNTALKDVIGSSFSCLENVCQQRGLSDTCLRLIQNDGSQMTMEEARAKPLLTLSCGPMNSAKGGSLLSKESSCVVVDIGGTSTDVALVHNGCVKRSSGIITVADVRMRFPSPDVISFALGGGSLVGSDGKVGPKSVARELFQASQAFGGSALTITDLALLLGFVEIAGADVSRIMIDKEKAREILEQQGARIIHAVRLMRGKNRDLPCVLVGGGAILFQKTLSKRLEGLFFIENNIFAGVANAFGATQSEISGQFDAVISLHDQEEALLNAERYARSAAIRKGADPKLLRLGHVAIEPFAYSHDKLARVTVSVIGPGLVLS